MENLFIFLSFLSALTIALLSAYVGHTLGLRGFKKEKWWSKRFENYVNIFNAINTLFEEFDYYIEREIKGLGIEESQQKYFQDRSREAKKEIEKQWRIGSFVHTAEACEAISNGIIPLTQVVR